MLPQRPPVTTQTSHLTGAVRRLGPAPGARRPSPGGRAFFSARLSRARSGCCARPAACSIEGQYGMWNGEYGAFGLAYRPSVRGWAGVAGGIAGSVRFRHAGAAGPTQIHHSDLVGSPLADPWAGGGHGPELQHPGLGRMPADHLDRGFQDDADKSGRKPPSDFHGFVGRDSGSRESSSRTVGWNERKRNESCLPRQITCRVSCLPETVLVSMQPSWSRL